jgi:hypothetical protein
LTNDCLSQIWFFTPNTAAREVEVNDGFDMYADLLGIAPGSRPPDYYTLLGVEPSETDAARIHAAAKRRITRLSSLLSGNRGKYAQQLMGEVATARAVLTTPEVKARYDEKLRSQGVAVPVVPQVQAPDDGWSAPPADADPRPLAQTVTMPFGLRPAPLEVGPAPIEPERPASPFQLPAAALVSRWAKTVESPPPTPDLPAALPTMAKARLVAGPGSAFQADSPGTTPPASLTASPPLPPPVIGPIDRGAVDVGATIAGNWLDPSPRPIPTFADILPTSPSVSLTDAPLSSALSTIGPSTFDDRSRARASLARRQKSSQAVVIAAVAFVVVGVAIGMAAVLVFESSQAPVAQHNQPRAEKVAGEAADKPAASESRANTTPSQQHLPGRDARGKQTAAADSAGMPDHGDTRLRDNSPAADPRPDPPAIKTPAPANKLADWPATNVAKPVSKPDATEPAADPAQTAAVAKSLRTAREALAARDMEKAVEQLDLADLEATTTSQRARLAGAKTLRHYVDRFWNAVRQSMASIKNQTELTVDGKTAIVVEFHPKSEKLTVHIEGRSDSWTAQEMPTSLAVALAEHWLDKTDTNSPAFVGAFLAISPREEEAKRGRRMLEEAKAAGSEDAAAVLDELNH